MDLDRYAGVLSKKFRGASRSIERRRDVATVRVGEMIEDVRLLIDAKKDGRISDCNARTRAAYNEALLTERKERGFIPEGERVFVLHHELYQRCGGGYFRNNVPGRAAARPRSAGPDLEGGLRRTPSERVSKTTDSYEDKLKALDAHYYETPVRKWVYAIYNSALARNGVKGGAIEDLHIPVEIVRDDLFKDAMNCFQLNRARTSYFYDEIHEINVVKRADIRRLILIYYNDLLDEKEEESEGYHIDPSSVDKTLFLCRPDLYKEAYDLYRRTENLRKLVSGVADKSEANLKGIYTRYNDFLERAGIRDGKIDVRHPDLDQVILCTRCFDRAKEG